MELTEKIQRVYDIQSRIEEKVNYLNYKEPDLKTFIKVCNMYKDVIKELQEEIDEKKAT